MGPVTFKEVIIVFGGLIAPWVIGVVFSVSKLYSWIKPLFN